MFTIDTSRKFSFQLEYPNIKLESIDDLIKEIRIADRFIQTKKITYSGSATLFAIVTVEDCSDVHKLVREKIKSIDAEINQ